MWAVKCMFLILLLLLDNWFVKSDVPLCSSEYCRKFISDVGCPPTAPHCSINNETHTGMWLPSPTLCNCCEYCLPFFGEGDECSLGGPGLGTTIGRCGHGLYCTEESTGNRCQRMDTACHRAQDDYDIRYANGETLTLEMRPRCDDKGKYAPFVCNPTTTCFCVSEEGERIFGEFLYMGEATLRETNHCGCSRFNQKITEYYDGSVPYPVVGPRCNADGSFNPVQCIDRICYCMDKLNGVINEKHWVDLDENPISELPCYEPNLDLYPEIGEEPPFNYTNTPCLRSMNMRIEEIREGEAEGFNMEMYSEIPECAFDGSYGRIIINDNGTKLCVDERGYQIGNYQAEPGTSEYNSMDCKCAITSRIMETSAERPVCCSNGNYRTIQCRRGQCYCVDIDGRQTTQESTDVTLLSCYSLAWRTC